MDLWIKQYSILLSNNCLFCDLVDKDVPLLNMTDCSLAQRPYPSLKVVHISTPAFLLTDCVGRGVTGRYETP